jgi:addiction module RelE/StbE family toxin
MRRIYYTTEFKKDLKRIRKQNKDAANLKAVIEKLAQGKLLTQNITIIYCMAIMLACETATLPRTGC